MCIPSKNLIVKHCCLYDIMGTVRSIGEMAFTAASVEIEQLSPIEFGFDREGILIDGSPLDGQSEDLWLAARIPRIFQYRPSPVARTGDPLISFAFLALERRSASKTPTAYPFALVERFDDDDALYEQPHLGLAFSKLGPSRRLKQKIADRFWELLRSAPSDLEPFVDFSYGAYGEYCLVGLDPSGFFREASWDEEHSDLFSPHFSYMPGEVYVCPECSETGIEDQFPFDEDCVTCGGTGRVAW